MEFRDAKSTRLCGSPVNEELFLIPKGHSLINTICLASLSLQQLYSLSIPVHILSSFLICISVYSFFFTHLDLSHLRYALILSASQPILKGSTLFPHILESFPVTPSQATSQCHESPSHLFYASLSGESTAFFACFFHFRKILFFFLNGNVLVYNVILVSII